MVSHLARGNQLLRSGKLEEAVAAYQKAIGYHPNFHWSHYKLGEALERLGRLEDSVIAYQRAVELKPEATWIYPDLERVLHKTQLANTCQFIYNEAYRGIEQNLIPNFLGIGTQKSGTTWLYSMLKQHPQIYFPNHLKELMFFDSEKRFKEIGIDGYRSFFESCSFNNHKAVGEITPGYLWTSPIHSEKYKINPFRFDIPKRVYNYLGDNIKLIVLLRNPVERAISAYCHHIHKKKLSSSDNILDVGREFGIIHIGFYSKHLSHWMEYYPPSAFNISIYESILNNKYDYLRKIFSFLSVDETYKPLNIDMRYNPKLCYKTTENGDISVFQNGQEITAINFDDIQNLYDIYQEDIDELQKLFNFDISTWKSSKINSYPVDIHPGV